MPMKRTSSIFCVDDVFEIFDAVDDNHRHETNGRATMTRRSAIVIGFDCYYDANVCDDGVDFCDGTRDGGDDNVYEIFSSSSFFDASMWAIALRVWNSIGKTMMLKGENSM
jgi:hypothetical protein